jgi:hypothetical protein
VDRKLQRSEVESLRRGTDCPMEFSLIGIPRITVDLTGVAATERLSHLRGLLGKVG